MRLFVIAVSFPFWTTEVPPRCKKPRRVDKIGSLNLGIPIFSEQSVDVEAPVAMTYTDEGREFSLRWYDGRFWSCCKLQDMFAVELDGSVVSNEPPFDLSGLWVMGGRAETLDTQQQFLQKMEKDWFGVNHGGNVVWWKPLRNEPRYAVETFGLGFNKGSTNLVLTQKTEHAPPCVFSVLQRGEAVSKAINVANKRSNYDDRKWLSDPVEVNKRVGEVQVLMPEVFQFNRDTVVASPVSALSAVYGANFVPPVASCSLDAITDWDDEWTRLAA